MYDLRRSSLGSVPADPGNDGSSIVHGSRVSAFWTGHIDWNSSATPFARLLQPVFWIRSVVLQRVRYTGCAWAAVVAFVAAGFVHRLSGGTCHHRPASIGHGDSTDLHMDHVDRNDGAISCHSKSAKLVTPVSFGRFVLALFDSSPFGHRAPGNCASLAVSRDSEVCCRELRHPIPAAGHVSSVRPLHLDRTRPERSTTQIR